MIKSIEAHWSGISRFSIGWLAISATIIVRCGRNMYADNRAMYAAEYKGKEGKEG